MVGIVNGGRPAGMTPHRRGLSARLVDGWTTRGGIAVSRTPEFSAESVMPLLGRRALLGGAIGLVGWSVVSPRGVAAQTVTPEADEPADVIVPRGTPAPRGTLTLYSGQHGEPTREIVAAFADATGITVQFRAGEDAELANQVIAEGDASPADVIYTENSPALVLLSDQGRLAKIDPETLARVPSRYNSPLGDWVGVAARATVLVYNPALLTEAALPGSILDLAKPEWQGKIGIAPAETDFQPLVSAVILLEGEDAARVWAEGLARNAETYRGNTPILRAVDSGELAAGIINHYYWFRLAHEVGQDQMHSKLYYFGHEDPGALVNVSGAGALASSKNPDLAQEFLTFLVSQRGQETLVQSGDFEYPLASGVDAAPELKPFDELNPPPLTIAALGDGRAAIELLEDVGLL
jgi:iron(III) transport system substrate-binding protein